MKITLPLLIALLVFATAACSGDSPDAAEETTSSPSISPTLSPMATEKSDMPAEKNIEESRPTAGTSDTKTTTSKQITDRPHSGTFRRLWSDPPTLDPHLTSDTTSAGIVVEIFGGLVALNTELQLVPDIAESWTIDGGIVYNFRLRPNAKFHNGKTVTAKDFKWSIERAAHPDTASPVADTYLNDIVGAMDYIDGTANEITGIRVIDDLSLQITIDSPKAYFLAKLTYPTAYVLDRNVVEAGGRNWWVDNAIGTGPFKLKEYKIGERIILERNPTYHRERARVDTVFMNLAGGQRMAMYENNEIDITGVGLFDLDRVLDPNEPLNKELVIAPPGFSVYYIGFNTNMAPFDDPKFRQALNHAIDKELIASEVLSELMKPAYTILPPGFPGHTPDIKGLTHNPDLAKQLLSESRYANQSDRPRIVITVPGTGGVVGLDLEVILEMWKQILSVEVEIQSVEWATYLEDLDNQKFQAFAGLGWEADYPDPQDFLDILFHSESPLNHGAYTNVDVDKLLQQARVEQDVLERIGLYHRAEQMIVSDAAWVPLWFTGEQYALVKPYVKGYKLTPMIIPKLKEVWIEE